ncbi:hypothetical protein CEE69_11275 [Rhodopirellula bahusiensis]|uniref:Uncharacterized protein n=1 Tax=Rhodopirellula bahusiensis TaxID=2014065 RepID=A0A2G1W8P0_9BACT|nr:hypothetical protein CEE69_11275 [Rhodopirellula bahusiensis]
MGSCSVSAIGSIAEHLGRHRLKTIPDRVFDQDIAFRPPHPSLSHFRFAEYASAPQFLLLRNEVYEGWGSAPFPWPAVLAQPLLHPFPLCSPAPLGLAWASPSALFR